MAMFVKMKIGDNCTTLIQTTDENAEYAATRGGKENVLNKLDNSLDKLLGQQIIAQCQLISNAFDQLKKQHPSPKKVNAEFGIQFNAEGDICIAKVAAQSSFKISFEWEL